MPLIMGPPNGDGRKGPLLTCKKRLWLPWARLYRPKITEVSNLTCQLIICGRKLFSAMLWRCPACESPIRHSEVDASPRLGALYRCHVCRLELVLDAKGEQLTVAPIEDESQRHLSKPRRTIPNQ